MEPCPRQTHLEVQRGLSLKPGAEQGRLVSGTSLVVQRLRLHAPNAGGLGSIPGQELIPHATTKIPRVATKAPVQPNK